MVMQPLNWLYNKIWPPTNWALMWVIPTGDRNCPRWHQVAFFDTQIQAREYARSLILLGHDPAIEIREVEAPQ